MRPAKSKSNQDNFIKDLELAIVSPRQLLPMLANTFFVATTYSKDPPETYHALTNPYTKLLWGMRWDNPTAFGWHEDYQDKNDEAIRYHTQFPNDPFTVLLLMHHDTTPGKFVYWFNAALQRSKDAAVYITWAAIVTGKDGIAKAIRPIKEAAFGNLHNLYPLGNCEYQAEVIFPDKPQNPSDISMWGLDSCRNWEGTTSSPIRLKVIIDRIAGKDRGSQLPVTLYYN